MRWKRTRLSCLIVICVVGFSSLGLAQQTAKIGVVNSQLVLEKSEEGKKALRTNKLPESIYENFKEVVNIVGGTLFNSPETPHLVLRDVFVCPDRLSSELRSLLMEPVNGLFLDVTIEDYGDGKMTMLANSVAGSAAEAG